MYELVEAGIITAEDAKRVSEVEEEVEEPVKEVAEEVKEEPVKKETEKPAKNIKYKVVKGDCLWNLAKKFGCTVSDILKLNKGIKNPDLIYIGQILVIPN